MKNKTAKQTKVKLSKQIGPFSKKDTLADFISREPYLGPYVKNVAKKDLNSMTGTELKRVLEKAVNL